MSSERTVVISLASPDRFDRIRSQHAELRRLHPDRFDDGSLRHVVCLLAPGASAESVLADHAGALPATIDTTAADASGGKVRLGAARNAGAAAAIELGASLLVFLDADCLPGDHLLARYENAAGTAKGDAAGREGTATRRLLLGPVTYLTEEETEGLAASAPVIPHPHPARPDPNDGEVVDVDPDATAEGSGAPDPFALFWSLSFACSPEVFARIGGFDETYAGYGGEDTDFAFAARRAGVGLRWVGGAHAFHRYHPVSSPPVEHVADIVANARIFFDRWRIWPMEGWLHAFRDLGLVTFDARSGWRLTAEG